MWKNHVWEPLFIEGKGKQIPQNNHKKNGQNDWILLQEQPPHVREEEGSCSGVAKNFGVWGLSFTIYGYYPKISI